MRCIVLVLAFVVFLMLCWPEQASAGGISFSIMIGGHPGMHMGYNQPYYRPQPYGYYGGGQNRGYPVYSGRPYPSYGRQGGYPCRAGYQGYSNYGSQQYGWQQYGWQQQGSYQYGGQSYGGYRPRYPLGPPQIRY